MRYDSRHEEVLSLLDRIGDPVIVPDSVRVPGGHARNSLTRSTVRAIGRFQSKKTGTSHIWDSSNERDRLIIAEADPDISYFKSQPCHLKGLGRRGGDATPDFLFVDRRGNWWLEEVKSDRALQHQGILDHFIAVAAALKAREIDYRLTISSEIRMAPRLANAKLINRVAEIAIDEQFQTAVANFLSARTATIDEIIEETPPASNKFAQIVRLIAIEFLRPDLRAPIDRDTIVSLAKAGGSI